MQSSPDTSVSGLLISQGTHTLVRRVCAPLASVEWMLFIYIYDYPIMWASPFQQPSIEADEDNHLISLHFLIKSMQASALVN